MNEYVAEDFIYFFWVSLSLSVCRLIRRRYAHRSVDTVASIDKTLNVSAIPDGEEEEEVLPDRWFLQLKRCDQVCHISGDH